ncbi:MAG: hypothetical protein K9M55_06710 [Candidatus Marinimicrobia bacterium]|nr:hypothetical protein [Candidatus Neomarinimicrobiota bacterium]MCF7922375.1 hypothetical protein [Candidatus Neomarinimicrobiota bacterium]
MRRNKNIIMASMLVALLMACSVMDDKSIPKNQYPQVEISDFEVDMARGYIRGKIQNNSQYDVSSAILKFELYSQSMLTRGSNNFRYRSSARRYAVGDSPDPATLLLSKKFLIRESLKPGYSTEFYFELKMDNDFSECLYTYEIVELKGR